MLKQENFVGYWWLPDEEDKKIYGTLKISEADVFILETLEHFKGNELIEKTTISTDFPIIFGIARLEGGNKDFNLKLLECSIISNNPNKLNYCKIIVSFFLKYSHSNDTEKSCFNKVSIRPLNIDKWALAKGFKFEPESSGSFSLDYNTPKVIVLLDSVDVKISIGFVVNYNFPNEQGFKMSQLAYVNIDFSESKEMNSLRKFVKIIQDFLTLAINHPLFIEEYEFITHKLNEENEKENLRYTFYQNEKYIDKRYKSVNPWNMLFTLNDIQTFCPNALSNWFTKQDEIKFTINNLFSTIYNGYLYVENTFLDYVFALEVYHRNRYPNQKLQSVGYLEKRTRIIENITNPSDKQWLEARLNEYKKEPNLCLRLENLNDIYGENYKDIFIADSLFIKKVVETRHYLVHHGVKYPELIIKDEFELYDCTQKLEVMIKAILLLEIGFDTKFINSRLKATKGWMAIFH